MYPMIERIEKIGEHWYGLALFLIIPSFLVFAPLLTGSKTLAWGDDVTQNAAYFAFWSRAIHSGDSVVWNPHNLAGFPIFATAFGFFAPWNFLIAAVFHSPFAFLNVLLWLTLISFAVGALCIVKLLRAFGLSFWSAYFGGLTFTFSHQTDAFYMPAVLIHVVLPILLFLLWRLWQKHSWWYVLGGSAAVALGWFAVNFQQMLYTVIAAGAFALFLFWYEWRDHGIAAAKRFFAKVFLIFFLGTLIGLIQLLPSKLVTDFSTRAQGVSYEFAAQNPVLPSDFLRWVIPDFKLPQGIPFGSRGASAPLYMGIIPLFFFLYALNPLGSIGRGFLRLWRWVLRKEQKRFPGRIDDALRTPEARAAFRFFTWTFWIIIATSIIYSPIFWVMAHLPVFSFFRVPDRWMFIAEISTAVLAAFGFEQFSVGFKAIGSIDSKFKKFFKIFTWITGAMFAGTVLLNIVFRLFEAPLINGLKRFFASVLYLRYQPNAEHPVSVYFAIIDRYFGDLHHYFSFGQPILASAVLMLLVSLVALIAIFRGGARKHSYGVLLMVVTLVNYVAVKSYDYKMASRDIHAATPATVLFLQSHPGRAMPFLSETFEESVVRPQYHPSGEDGVQYRFAMLVANTNLFYNIDSATIKDNLAPAAIARLVSYVAPPVVPNIPPHFLPSDSSDAARALTERKPLLDFLGIRYFISGYQLDEKVFPKVFSGTVSSVNIPLSIYENRGARGLISFATGVTFATGTDQDMFEHYRDQGFNGIFVACSTPCVPGTRNFGNAHLDTLEEKNTVIRAKTSSDHPAFLIFSQNYMPGWHAAIDHTPTAIEIVNTAFMGLEVPSGSHEVIFVYENPCGIRSLTQCLASLIH